MPPNPLKGSYVLKNSKMEKEINKQDQTKIADNNSPFRGSGGLIPAAESYSFSDLIAFQTLIKLRENKISSREILRALESLREKLGWVKQPLSELRVVSDGGRIAVQLSGQKMEAISGQILFDFDA